MACGLLPPGRRRGRLCLGSADDRMKLSQESRRAVNFFGQTPLHANGVENDIRDQVAQRKVSFGTRSDAGRTARDDCIGAKKTYRKLGVPCRDYQRNRLGVADAPDVPRLADLVMQRTAA